MPTEAPNLDEFLPDTQIQKDLSNILWKDSEECEVELEEGKLKIPCNTLLEIISKSYRKNIYPVGFGNYYAAQVAIGGIKEQRSGILYPVYCFATLFYDSDKDLITTDVHSEMR